MNRVRSSTSSIWILLGLLLGAVSCKHNVAAAPAAPAFAASSAPAAAPPAITVRTDRAAITRGQSATLTVTTQNATSVTMDPALGSFPLNGSRQITPASSVTYVATARGPGGTSTDSVRVTVNDPPPPTAAPVRSPSTNASATPLTLDQQFERSMRTVLFDYDKADIRSEEIDNLRTAAAFLKGNPSVRITIEGHCDERGSEEYNLALGDRRANAVRQYLIAQGVAEPRLSSVSYGEEKSICHDQSEECYQRNRRAAFRRIP